MKRFANPSQSQIIAVGVLLAGIGAMMNPPSQVAAQPSEAIPPTSSNLAQATGIPQPLATPLSTTDASASTEISATSPRTTRAVGTITGQGTVGYISKFTGANAIGNSVIFENAGKVGIGLTNPAGLLSIKGTANNVYPLYALNTTAGTAIVGSSTGAVGVYGLNTGATASAGVLGETSSTAANATGIQGTSKATSPGTGAAGVRGINNGTGSNGFGVYGSHAGGGDGVYGKSSNGTGVEGISTNSTGVQGSSSSGSGVGVEGISTNYLGVYGNSTSNIGVEGYSRESYGVEGTSYNGTAIHGTTINGTAGAFDGDVKVTGNLSVTGTLSKGAGSFKIDHPLHPATQYLSHSFVESPDMMNVYNGNTKTNGKGEVWVQLPTYFSALNRDFRYQLTPMGQFAQVIVGQKIKGNRFLIRTDKPGVEVSWQVTGIRNDAYARQHRIQVEQTKAAADQGKYLYPAGFGFSKDKQIGASLPRLAKR